jgi:hemoglobin
MARTMFERYGGFAVISRVVSSFYDKAVESPVLAPYFEGVDMRRLIDHQTKFIAAMMGGPASFSDDMLERVHANLGINEKAFLEMAGLFKETMEDFDMDDSDVAVVYRDILGKKHLIVTKA